MTESTRDTAVTVIAEAFNTAHRPTPDFPDLEEVNRHDGHHYDGGCWLCRGDVAKLAPHIVDALIAAGLLPQPVEPASPPAAVLRKLADQCDTDEFNDITIEHELVPAAFRYSHLHGKNFVVPEHPVTRVEIHHKPAPEVPVREGEQRP